jgi:hypothetical protein
MPLRAVEVFTPNDYPSHTYVERGGAELERSLRNALQTPKAVVSVSGPSKSGKTVLIERAVTKDNLIVVSGAEIRAPEDIWNRILDWMGSPSSRTDQSTETIADQVSGKMSGGVDIPLVVKIGGEGGYQRTDTTATATTATSSRGGLVQVQLEIAGSDFVVLVDDFHYMPRDVQVEAARQIKAGAERGIRFCVASVPHRSDDVVRSNPELRGRTTNIDSTFWSTDELEQIALLGFAKLGTEVSRDQATEFAHEACGSPQLMQSICLNACLRLGIDEEQQLKLPLALDAPKLRAIFETTSAQSDYSSLVTRMHAGPKTRGTERKEHRFNDGTVGDVYRCMLLAIVSNPPVMGLPWADLTNRVEKVCRDGVPAGSSLKEACKQISSIALEMYPEQRIIEWDEETDTLTVVDPYLLFYLRSSAKLSTLAKA